MVDPEPPPPRPPRSLKRKLSFAALSWLVVALSLEGVVRIRERYLYGTFSRAGTTLYEKPKDGGQISLTKGAEISGSRMQVHINSLGFRGREVSVPKPPGTTRVVCLGASTTFDIFSESDEATWPSLLESKLRARHPGVEVVNAGVAGWTVDSFLSDSVWKRIADLSPDVVLTYFATNELSAEARKRFDVARYRCTSCGFEVRQGEGQGSAGFVFTAGEMGPAGAGPSKAPPCPKCGGKLELYDPSKAPRASARALKAITDWSLFAYKVWLFVDSHTKPPDPEGTHDLPPEAALSFESKLRELSKRIRSVGARPVFMTFALRWRPDQPLETKRSLAGGAFNIYFGLSLDGIDRAMAGYNEAIARVARDENALLVPVSEQLSGDPSSFGDFVHFSTSGSERMASLVASSLDPSLDR